jgi:tetratricopeptide (TPR) repeat protein
MPFVIISAARPAGWILLLTLALGASLLRAQENPTSFDDLAARAAAARDSGAASDAIRYYRGAVQLRPDWVEGWWYLGTLLYDADRSADALPAFRRVTELDPNLGPAWAFLGLCEFELGQYRESFEHLDRAKQLGFAENPELRKVALYHLAILRNANGQFELATDLLVSEFGSGRVNDQVRTAMGMALLRIPLLPSQLDPAKDALVDAAGETASLLAMKDTSAFDSFERMLREFPDTPYLHVAYGLALASAGKIQSAGEQFREEARLNPTSPLPLVALASVELRLNRPNEALSAAKQAAHLAPEDRTVHQALAAAYQALGQNGLAQSARAREAELTAAPAPTDANQVARYSLHDGKFAGVSATAAPASIEPQFQAAVRQGEAAQQAGRLDEATKAYTSALALRPDWSDAWRRLGTIAYMQSKYAEAAAALKRAVVTEPKQADAWTLLGLSEFEMRDFQNARLHLERGSTLGFGGNAAAVKFAKCHLALLLNLDQEFDRATDLLIPEVGPGPLAPEIQFAMGLALLRIPLLPEQVGPEQRVLVNRAGEVATVLSQRHYDQAFRLFDAMLREHPNTPFLHYAYGASLANISEFDRAQAQLREEIRVNPNSPLPYLRLASIQVFLHEGEAAAGNARKAVVLAPDSADAHYVLGRSALELGDTALAVKELETARELVPGSPAVHFNLARAYAKAGRREDADRERAEFRRLNQLMNSQPPVQGPEGGLSQASAGVSDSLSGPPN